MGCHTWVYGYRKPYDIDLVREKAKELYKEDKAHWKLIKHLYLTLSESKTIDSLKIYAAGFNLANEIPVGDKERREAFDEWENTFTRMYGKDLNTYISYVWYNLVYDEEEIPNYHAKMRKHISEVDKANRRYCAHANYFKETALEKLYNTKGLIEVLEEEGTYAVEAEYHDPFRVYGYPENVLKSRKEAEEFLFDRDSDLFMTAYDWGKPEYEAIDKKENYDLFVKLISHQLDIIYKDVPDAVITFG